MAACGLHMAGYNSIAGDDDDDNTTNNNSNSGDSLKYLRLHAGLDRIKWILQFHKHSRGGSGNTKAKVSLKYASISTWDVDTTSGLEFPRHSQL